MKAGDSARVDELQALANLEKNTIQLNDALAKREAAQLALLALVQATNPKPPKLEKLAQAAEITASSIELNTSHAELEQLRKSIEAAKARLKEAEGQLSESPRVSAALSNDRSRDSHVRNTARVGISAPLDFFSNKGSFRAPQIAQAQRELAELETKQLLAERGLHNAVAAAAAQLRAARANIDPTKRRAQLASDAADLYDKAFRLGELDFPTRLRIEGERASALRDARRAQLEVDQAASRLNQSLGLLP